MRNQIPNTVDIIKTYRWRSIFFVYFKKILVFILVPLLVISLLAGFYVKKTFEYNYRTNFNEAFYKTFNSANDMFIEADKCFDILYTPDLFVYMQSTISGKADDSMRSTRKIQEYASTFLQASKYVSNISAYRFTDNYIVSTLNGGFVDNFHNTDWLSIYYETNQENFLYFHKSNAPGVPDTLSFIRSVRSGDRILGFLIFDINQYVLKNMLTFSHNENVVSVLAEGDGTILYSEDISLIGKNTEILTKYPNYREEGNENCTFVTFTRTEINNLAGSSVMPLMLGAVILSLILSAVIALFIAFQFYKSIFSLYTSFATADIYSDKANDEISQIVSSVMKVVDKNEQFEKELNEKVISLRKSQSIALQTQLNPHFLFNTLSMINLMVISITKGDNDVSRVITLLSELLREALKTQEYIVPLETELAYVEKFIEIEKIKHKNSFNVEFDIDPATTDLKVVKFMLQPIVENAFEHGINGSKEKNKFIKISTYKTEGNLIISVKNNGEGISEQKLQKIKERLKTDIIPEDRHIGMFNVNSRIKIVFGTRYGVDINCDGNITEVTLSLPNN